MRLASRVQPSRAHYVRKMSTPTQASILSNLGLDGAGTHPGVFNGKWSTGAADTQMMVNPSDGSELGLVGQASLAEYEATVAAMDAAKVDWMMTPAPVRGEVVRVIGEKLRTNIDDLGGMVSLEMGKIFAEGVGEVQEAVDICEFAVGLSRSLNGQVRREALEEP